MDGERETDSESLKIKNTLKAQGQRPNGLSLDTILPGMRHERDISVAVDPVALITTECITVTSAMRKHARWAHSSVSAILGGGPAFAHAPEQPKQSRGTGQNHTRDSSKDAWYPPAASDNLLASRWGLRGRKGRSMQDDPLIAAFARLRNDLRGCT
ncbi:MAG: hypothetical protein Q9220_005385, partial [cf. Caloplaca sp. 1 TL-2023]